MNELTKLGLVKDPRTHRGQRMIIEMPLTALVEEYKLVKSKQSKLPNSVRYMIYNRVQFLITKGILDTELNIKHMSSTDNGTLQ